jgi:hypothetical protein
MRVWQLQEAEAKLSQLINEAMLKPQIISRDGIRENCCFECKKISSNCFAGNKALLRFLETLH